MTVLRSNVAVKPEEVFEGPGMEKPGVCNRSEKNETTPERGVGFLRAACRKQRDQIIMWDEV